MMETVGGGLCLLPLNIKGDMWVIKFMMMNVPQRQENTLFHELGSLVHSYSQLIVV